jgi:hypothetical protein
MAPRFYTNPFTKDAELVVAREFTEWRYLGKSHRFDGSFDVWTRDVKYSDGSTRSEDEERLIGPFPFVDSVRLDLTMYEDDGTGRCRNCRRLLDAHSGPTTAPDLCPHQPR